MVLFYISKSQVDKKQDQITFRSHYICNTGPFTVNRQVYLIAISSVK